MGEVLFLPVTKHNLSAIQKPTL